jgi:subtilisin family serine protease
MPVKPSEDAPRSRERRNEQSVVVRGTVDSESIKDIEARPEVVRVWRDAPIAPFRGGGPRSPGINVVGRAAFGTCPIEPCDCEPDTAKGDISDVASYLGVDRLWDAGFRGSGAVVGIVDGGINAPGVVPRVVDGFRGDWGTRADWSGHGNMTSTDALGMAPDAELHDIRIAESDVDATISAALEGYQWAIEHHERDGTPHILSNSWGIYQQSWASDYATNPNHPFTRKVVEAIDAGIIVLFSAGNCGDACPSGSCGSDRGPGRSIWGANGHPRVMTVGAATTYGDFVGYSSTGPASLDDRKPDFCGISHFRGYFSSDNGTSAACPIAAGVVALMKGGFHWLDQEIAKAALSATARDIGNTGWDYYSGWGIIRADDALNYVTELTLTLIG